MNAAPTAIEGRLLGDYKLGPGIPDRTFGEDYMTFSRGGLVNAPRRAHAIWFLAQYRRLGLLKEDPPYQELADSLILRDLYEDVAAKEKVPVPDDDMSPFPLKLDNTTFDPARPLQEVARI